MTGVQTCALPIYVAPPVMNYQDKEVFVVDEVGVTVRPDNGYDALASVDINPVLESKVVNVTSNGTTSVVPSDGFCGIGDITVNVNVPSVDSVKTQIGNIVFDYTPPKSYTCKVNNMIDLGSYANLTTFYVYSAPEAVQITHFFSGIFILIFIFFCFRRQQQEH